MSRSIVTECAWYNSNGAHFGHIAHGIYIYPNTAHTIVYYWGSLDLQLVIGFMLIKAECFISGTISMLLLTVLCHTFTTMLSQLLLRSKED